MISRNWGFVCLVRITNRIRIANIEITMACPMALSTLTHSITTQLTTATYTMSRCLTTPTILDTKASPLLNSCPHHPGTHKKYTAMILIMTTEITILILIINKWWPIIIVISVSAYRIYNICSTMKHKCSTTKSQYTLIILRLQIHNSTSKDNIINHNQKLHSKLILIDFSMQPLLPFATQIFQTPILGNSLDLWMKSAY